MEKILQISNYMYPHIGGIEQVTRDVCNALRDEEVEVRIICFNEDASSNDVICHRRETVTDQVDGVSILRCGCVGKIRSQSISFTFPSELKKLLRGFKPDIVVFHYPNPFAAHWLLRYLSPHTKLIIYWHMDIIKQKVLRILFEGQNDRLLRRADKVVATSPNYVEGSLWLQKAREKCVIIPNCVRTEQMKPTRKAQEEAERFRKLNKGKILCLAVGRNVPYKGLLYLVQASKYLDDRFVIYIAGEGTEKMASQIGADQKVRLLGTVGNDTLKGLMAASDIFCFPSVMKNEGFGIALAEGMYYGKPAVTFTIPGSGVNYVNIDGETGIEAPNGDAVAYAQALTRLADDPALRRCLGENGAARVKALFTEELFRQNIRQLIHAL